MGRAIDTVRMSLKINGAEGNGQRPKGPALGFLVSETTRRQLTCSDREDTFEAGG